MLPHQIEGKNQRVIFIPCICQRPLHTQVNLATTHYSYQFKCEWDLAVRYGLTKIVDIDRFSFIIFFKIKFPCSCQIHWSHNLLYPKKWFFNKERHISNRWIRILTIAGMRKTTTSTALQTPLNVINKIS
jgi:hypothetical protein